MTNYGPGPGGVTHRCTLLTQGVHPTLFMLGPLKLTPEVSGSSGPHCVEQVDFWGESLEGRERARQSSILCRCRKSSPPRGTNSIMAMGPAGGQYSPTPLRRNGFQLGGGVRQRTSHRKLALLRSGWDFLFGHLPGDSIPPPHSRPDWKVRHPLHSARFLFF